MITGSVPFLIAPTTRVSVPAWQILLETEMTVPYRPEQVWPVITDYNNLGRYIPNLGSRVVSHQGDRVLVEQFAGSSLVPILRFRLLLAFERPTYERLEFYRLEGNLTRFEGYWEVQAQRQGTLVAYRLTAQHHYPLPGFVLRSAIQTDTEKIMPAIATEIQRRYSGG